VVTAAGSKTEHDMPDNEVSRISEEIIVKFWGVRGSIPSPGPLTARYGGNTSCVTVEGTSVLDGVRRLGVLDAGTGIRNLSKALAADDVDIVFLLSHTHWDHIQGFPFFAPIYQPDRRIFISRMEDRRGLFRLLLEQVDGTRFPLNQEQIQAQLESYSDLQLQDFADAGYEVNRLRVNHPGETYGFRADLRGASIVYIPDNELDPPYPPIATVERIADFCRDADVLIHDAMYTEADMPEKCGWGHSVIGQVWEMAALANVRHLVLFHHDPDRTDDDLDAIQAESEEWFARNAPQTRCTVAYEGLEIAITPAIADLESSGPPPRLAPLRVPTAHAPLQPVKRL
jgi:phosphoribosyl 1,2-cyclic phosphodiesterase